jgi:hypothetical protein
MQLRETAYLNFLQFPETTATEDFYKIVQIIINSQTVFNMQAYAALRGVTWEGLTGKDERWRLVSLIMVELSRAGYRVYWEKYGTIYKPWTFIIDADGQQLPSSINIDNTATAGTNSDVFFRTKFTNTPVKQFPGRFYFQTILPQMQEGAFSDTYYRSPLCYQEDDRVVVQYDDSFIVSGLRLYHIRRPRPVDLSLSENCELPETAQVDICDLAIEYIKGLRADPDWENKLRDNMTRTII